ncbi:MAG TPA: aspartate carbamoyltransferase [Candidatus Brocadiia bacterium]|nr:aspartate carbamoyltransferase [Candidatus Brocadiia bacterium]
MSLSGRDIISVRDFSRSEIETVMEAAGRMLADAPHDLLSGRLMASLFFEPSTRTRLSFETAMHRLGGRVVSVSGSEGTSLLKGESLSDTISVVAGYCDCIVLRHPVEGASRLAADLVGIPIINAGDGAHEHPTQTFLDLFTIFNACRTLDGLQIGFLGDLKYGRTVHSLAHAMMSFKSRLRFVAPPSLQLPDDLAGELQEGGVEFDRTTSVEEVLPELDILYCTRIQKERFGDEAEYTRMKGIYHIDAKLLQRTRVKPSLRIMHPLPRVDELNPDVDQTEHALYIQQAHNGVPTRMALLGLVLGGI